jgi:hypothetical protein
MHGAAVVQPLPFTHSGAGHTAGVAHAPTAQPTVQRHELEQSTCVHVPEAAQLKLHAFAPHRCVPVHEGEAAQFTWHVAAFAQSTSPAHDPMPVHWIVQLAASRHVSVPPHEGCALHWIVQLAACAQSIVPLQLLAFAHTSRHGTFGGHAQSVPQLIRHSPATQDPVGHVDGSQASTSASARASAAPEPEPEPVPSERAPNPIRPQATATSGSAVVHCTSRASHHRSRRR